MLDWIVMALMTGAAVMAALWPLSRRRGVVPESATDTAFYRAQLSEIDRDAERGLLGPIEAEAARNEAARRLLQTAKADAAEEKPASRLHIRAAAIFALIVIPALSVALYARLGRPGQADMPLSVRLETPAQQDVAALLARVEKRLAEHPDDAVGWQAIAPVYMAGERYGDAVHAFQSVIRISGKTPERLASLAEALIAQAGGVVTVDARKALDEALAGNPRLMSARYYKAMAAEQDGKTAEALADLRELAVDMPAQAPATQTVRERIRALEASLKQPSASEAVAALPEKDRMATIRSMVDGLEQRLMQGGGDADNWMRLLRALAVLGEKDRAKVALARARTDLASDALALGRVEAFARENGVD